MEKVAESLVNVILLVVMIVFLGGHLLLGKDLVDAGQLYSSQLLLVRADGSGYVGPV